MNMMLDLLHLVFLVTAAAAAKQPNIIFMLVEDMGWNDASFHGSNQIPTPNLDALGTSGIIFQRHYTLPSGTPTRVALLTGKYPIRTGLQSGPPAEGGVKHGIPVGIPLLPEHLKKLGYTTRMVGKWQLGFSRSAFTPLRRGFDSHYGCFNGYIDYYTHIYENQSPSVPQKYRYRGLDLRRNLKPDNESNGEYILDVLTKEAKRVIEDHDVSKPLFLYFPYLTVHKGNDSIPIQVRSIKHTNETFKYIENPFRQRFADIATEGDKTLGKLIVALKDKKMLENSIIVFASDNGAMPVESYLANYGSNWPLRGARATYLEGGVRCLAAAWSPLIKGRRVSYEYMHLVDWLPTLYRAAGGNPSNLGPLDGKDMWDYLTGKKRSSGRKEILINIDEKTGYKAIISGKWKYLEGTVQNGIYDKLFDDFEVNEKEPAYDADKVAEAAASMELDLDLTKETVLALRKEATISCKKERKDTLGARSCTDGCLFDIIKDPCEMDNVIDSNPNVVQLLLARLDKYEAGLVKQINTPVDPRSNPDNFGGFWQPWLDIIRRY